MFLFPRKSFTESLGHTEQHTAACLKKSVQEATCGDRKKSNQILSHTRPDLRLRPVPSSYVNLANLFNLCSVLYSLGEKGQQVSFRDFRRESDFIYIFLNMCSH